MVSLQGKIIRDLYINSYPHSKDSKNINYFDCEPGQLNYFHHSSPPLNISWYFLNSFTFNLLQFSISFLLKNCGSLLIGFPIFNLFFNMNKMLIIKYHMYAGKDENTYHTISPQMECTYSQHSSGETKQHQHSISNISLIPSQSQLPATQLTITTLLTYKVINLFLSFF